MVRIVPDAADAAAAACTSYDLRDTLAAHIASMFVLILEMSLP